MENISLTAESVKRKITDSFSEKLTDSDLESKTMFLDFKICMPSLFHSIQI